MYLKIHVNVKNSNVCVCVYLKVILRYRVPECRVVFLCIIPTVIHFHVFFQQDQTAAQTGGMCHGILMHGGSL